LYCNCREEAFDPVGCEHRYCSHIFQRLASIVMDKDTKEEDIQKLAGALLTTFVD
jgi:hypothetical protein